LDGFIVYFEVSGKNYDVRGRAQVIEGCRASANPLHPSPGSSSGEVGYAVPQLRPADEGGDDRYGVDDAEYQADVDAGVIQPLPGELAVRYPILHPAVEALRHGPQPLVDDPLPVGALHVYAVLHRQHVGRVLPAFQTPPGDDVVHLPGLEGVEDVLGLELAVRDQELHLQILPENPVQQGLQQLLLVHVRRSLHVAEGKPLDVLEEEGEVSEVEAVFAPAHPCLGVSEAPARVVGVPAAPRRQVGAVYAGGLDEACGCEGLALPQPQRLPAEPRLYDAEALGPDAALHLGEVGLTGSHVAVSADLAEVGVPPEPLRQVLHVGYLEELSEHQRPEVPLRPVDHWSTGALGVEPGPEDGMDRS